MIASAGVVSTASGFEAVFPADTGSVDNATSPADSGAPFSVTDTLAAPPSGASKDDVFTSALSDSDVTPSAFTLSRLLFPFSIVAGRSSGSISGGKISEMALMKDDPEGDGEELLVRRYSLFHRLFAFMRLAPSVFIR